MPFFLDKKSDWIDLFEIVRRFAQTEFGSIEELPFEAALEYVQIIVAVLPAFAFAIFMILWIRRAVISNFIFRSKWAATVFFSVPGTSEEFWQSHQGCCAGALPANQLSEYS